MLCLTSTDLSHDIDGFLEVLFDVDFGDNADLVAEDGYCAFEAVEFADLGVTVVTKLVWVPVRDICFIACSNNGDKSFCCIAHQECVWVWVWVF
jgi:hypothetical protein